MINQLVELAGGWGLSRSAARDVGEQLRSPAAAVQNFVSGFKNSKTNIERIDYVYMLILHRLAMEKNSISVDISHSVYAEAILPIVEGKVTPPPLTRVLPYGAILLPDTAPAPFIVFVDTLHVLRKCSQHSPTMYEILKLHLLTPGDSTMENCIASAEFPNFGGSMYPREYLLMSYPSEPAIGSSFYTTGTPIPESGWPSSSPEDEKAHEDRRRIVAAVFHYIQTASPKRYAYAHGSETHTDHKPALLEKSVRVSFDSSSIILLSKQENAAVLREGGVTSSSPKVKHWVREHYCNQPCGPGRRLRKRVLRKSHQRGSLEIEHNQGYVTEK